MEPRALCILGKHSTTEPHRIPASRIWKDLEITTSRGSREEDRLVKDRISNTGGFREVCAGSEEEWEVGSPKYVNNILMRFLHYFLPLYCQK